jgi:HEPN domain-containing protein
MDMKNISYYTMSLEYLNIGKISSNSNNKTTEYGNAVAYQLFHALELFLKYAILFKDNERKIIKTHDLEKLFKIYKSLYPEVEFELENPFSFSDYESLAENIDEENLARKHLEKFKPKLMDLHLRYPPDENTGGYVFSFDLSYFEKFEQEFQDIFSKIHQS